MATWLDHATWFFNSAWGDVITGIAVPVVVAGGASLLVIRQIRIAEQARHSAEDARAEDLVINQKIRQDDRRAEAVSVLAEYIADAATIAVDRVRLPDMALHTFRANAALARAYGLLGVHDRIVGTWAAHETAYMNNLTHAWGAEAAPKNEITFDGLIGEERSRIQRIGAEAIQELLNWQGGDRDLDWFADNIRPVEGGPVRQTEHIYRESEPDQADN